MARTHMTRRNWFAGSIAAVVLTCGWIWVTGETSRLDLTTAEVTVGPVERTIVATGTLQAVTTVQVGTQVSGVVQSLGADFNSIVRKGQIIAELDPSLYRAQLEQARAAESQAAANLTKAEADLSGLQTALEDTDTKLTRAQALFDDALIPTADIDAARIDRESAAADVSSGRSRVAQARAAVDQARANVAQAEQNLSYTVIRSPIDGIILARSVDIGQTLAASVSAPELFRVASDFTRLQLQVDLDESDVAGPTAGEPASFQVEAYPEESFTGTVTQVRLQPVAEQTISSTAVGAGGNAPGATTSVASVVGYTTIIAVDNPSERLRPGMTATVTLGGVRHERAIRIPNAALSFRPGADLEAQGQVVGSQAGETAARDDVKPRVVWRLDGARFTPVAVHTGLTDSTWTEMADGGLHPGDRVVTTAVVRHSRRLTELWSGHGRGTLG